MTKFTRIVCISAVVAFVILAAVPLYAVDFGKIMPLGDSITHGTSQEYVGGKLTVVDVPGGYRDPLYTRLTAAGNQLTFVGSATDSNPSPMLTAAGQTANEGHGGYIIDGNIVGATRAGLDENLAAWIGPGGKSPDIILLMIGTNDIGTDCDVTNAPARLNDLIRDIYTYQPNASLYVASITPRPAYKSKVLAYNAEIPGIVDACREELKVDIHFVDMYTPLLDTGRFLCPDNLHPNATGYDKIAEVWYDALTVPEPSTIAMLPIIGAALLAYALRKWKWRTIASRTRPIVVCGEHSLGRVCRRGPCVPSL